MTRNSNTLVLALATLDESTEIEIDPISVVQPKVAKASTLATVMCYCPWHYFFKYIANVREPLLMFLKNYYVVMAQWQNTHLCIPRSRVQV